MTTKPPKASTPRVKKLRAGLASKGAKRWELSPAPHVDDRPAIKEFADKLAAKRARKPKEKT